MSPRQIRPAASSLAFFLASAGVTHFAKPGFFAPMIPRALPGGRGAWVAGSGVAELVVAGAVALPQTRRVGGLAAAALFVAVFPANVYSAMRTLRRPESSTRDRVIQVARLPLQVPLVLWALRAARPEARKV